MASYEEQAFYIYELIENINNGIIDYTKIIFNTYKLNKMHFEYLSDSILEFYQDNKELVFINNEYFIIKINDSYIKIDIHKDLNEYFFKIHKENNINNFEL